MPVFLFGSAMMDVTIDLALPLLVVVVVLLLPAVCVTILLACQ